MGELIDRWHLRCSDLSARHSVEDGHDDGKIGISRGPLHRGGQTNDAAANDHQTCLFAHNLVNDKSRVGNGPEVGHRMARSAQYVHLLGEFIFLQQSPAILRGVCRILLTFPKKRARM